MPPDSVKLEPTGGVSKVGARVPVPLHPGSAPAALRACCRVACAQSGVPLFAGEEEEGAGGAGGDARGVRHRGRRRRRAEAQHSGARLAGCPYPDRDCDSDCDTSPVSMSLLRSCLRLRYLRERCMTSQAAIRRITHCMSRCQAATLPSCRVSLGDVGVMPTVQMDIWECGQQSSLLRLIPRKYASTLLWVLAGDKRGEGREEGAAERGRRGSSGSRSSRWCSNSGLLWVPVACREPVAPSSTRYAGGDFESACAG